MKSMFRPRDYASKHSNLFSQQRRLRHLTCIIGRNIDPNLVPISKSMKSSLLMLYFTIHDASDLSTVFYKSEIIENTLNPNWKEFDNETFYKSPAYNTLSEITVIIWGARKLGQFRAISRSDINFSGLVFLQENLRKHEGQYESNCLLFQMFGGYYASASALPKEKLENRILSENTRVPNHQVKSSYKQSSLMRLHGVIKAIQQTRQQVNTVQGQMDALLGAHQSNTEKTSKKELLTFTNKLLSEELNQLKQKHDEEKRARDREKEELRKRERILEEKTDDLEQYISRMKISHSAHMINKESLSQFTSRLAHRRRQLAAELSYIFPIIELPALKDSKHEYAISGVRLPNSEDFVGEDDTMLSVSLGYVAQLVYMMAKFLELPLRYPIKAMGSRSSVFDPVTDKLTDRQREFPLYLKGKEFQFHYGVFLLNKNIAQLRYHNEIGTSDLRNTLENLKRLLEDKFGVRIVMKSGSGISNTTTLSRLKNVKNHSYKHTTAITRQNSLPVGASSPINPSMLGSSPNSQQQNQDSTDFLSPVEEDRPFRPRSMVLSSTTSSSGLPAVPMKSNQHPYIARKSFQRKNQQLRKTKSVSQSISPDLITTTCEDILRMAQDAGRENSQAAATNFQDPTNISHLLIDSNTRIIDCAEDCLSNESGEHESHENEASGSYGNQISNEEDEDLRPLERTFSDALIIPDPFEREPDDLLSPDTNITDVNNLIV